MSTSAGDADREMDVVTNSLEYKINKLKETGTGIWQNIFPREDIGNVVDGATSVLNVVDSLTEHLGLFGTAAAALGTAAFIKNFGGIKDTFSTIVAGMKVATSTLGMSFGSASIEAAGFAFSSLAESIGLTAASLSGFIGVAAGIAGVFGLIDLFTESFDEARDKADEAIASYEDNKAQLEDVNSQLETTQERMNQLKTQGGLTFVEQAELANLEAANNQLLAQKSILEQTSAILQEQAAREAANVLTKKEYAGKEIYQPGAFGDVLVGAESLDVLERWAFVNGRIEEQTSEYNDIATQLNEINAEKSKINDRLEQYTDAEKQQTFWGDSPYEKDVKALQELDAQQEALVKRQGELQGSISGYRDLLPGLSAVIQQYMSALTDVNGNPLPGVEDVWQKVQDLYLGIEYDTKKQAAKNQQEYDKIINSREAFQNQYKELVEKAKSQAETGGLTAEDLTGYDELVNAMTEGGFTAEDIVMNVNAKAEIINKDELKSQVSDQLEQSISDLESDNEKKIESGLEIEFDVEQAKKNKDKILEIYDQLPVESQKKVADYLASHTDWQGLETGDVENYMNAIVNGSQDAASAASSLTGTLQDLQLVFNDTTDDSLTKAISKYKEQMTSLQQAKDKWDKGELSVDDMMTLQQSFIDLNGYDMSNFGEGIEKAMGNVVGKSKEMDDALESSTGIVGEFERAIATVGGEDTEAGRALVTMRDNLLGLFDQTEQVTSAYTKLKDTLSTFSQYQSDVSSALKSSVSATGLSADQVQTLQSAYKDLSSYNPDRLFEKTANGIHLNEEEFKRLNEEVQNSTLLQMYSYLAYKYDELHDARARGDDTSGLEKDIADAQMLIAQYEGLTSALYAWQNAQSNGNERDSFESVAKGYSSMKEILDQGWYGDESLNSYLDLMLSASERTGDAATDFEKLGKTIEGAGHSLKDYFSFEDGKLTTDGLEDFLDDVNTVLGDSFSSIDENGKRTFDFTGEKLQQVADAFGTTTEFVELMARAMVDAGMQVSFADSNFESLKQSLTSLQQEGKISSDIDLSNFDTATASVKDFDTLIQDLKDEEVRINAEVDGSEESQEALETIQRSVDTLENAKISKSISLAIDNGTSIDEMLSMDNTTLQATLNVDSTEVEEARAQLESLNGMTEQTTITVTIENSQFEQLTKANDTISVTYEVEAPEEPEYKDQDPTVTYTVDAPPEPEYPDQNPSVTYSLSAPPEPTYNNIERTVTYTINTVGSPPSGGGGGSVDGTAHVKGTAFASGNAFANGNRSGDWGTRSNGFALGGELGEELIVRDGRYFTIGANSAEFFKYRKDDINKIVSLYSDVYVKII